MSRVVAVLLLLRVVAVVLDLMFVASGHRLRAGGHAGGGGRRRVCPSCRCCGSDSGDEVAGAVVQAKTTNSSQELNAAEPQTLDPKTCAKATSHPASNPSTRAETS